MKHRRLLPFLTIALLSASCHFSANTIDHVWFYTYSESPQRDLTPSSFLECQKDGSYTRDFGQFDYGTWRLEDHKLYLTDHLRHTSIYPVDMSKPKEMQLTLREGSVASFERQPLPDQKNNKDPFSLENNRWRIPADHKESDQEIRTRLYNHCRFWETYFTWALDNEVSSIDVRSTPTCIKIYGNGFTLKPLNELPAAWKTCFFDREDCQRANAIIEEIFNTRNIAWAHTDNKYKLFIGAFQQMESFLK